MRSTGTIMMLSQDPRSQTSCGTKSHPAEDLRDHREQQTRAAKLSRPGVPDTRTLLLPDPSSSEQAQQMPSSAHKTFAGRKTGSAALLEWSDWDSPQFARSPSFTRMDSRPSISSDSAHQSQPQANYTFDQAVSGSSSSSDVASLTALSSVNGFRQNTHNRARLSLSSRSTSGTVLDGSDSSSLSTCSKHRVLADSPPDMRDSACETWDDSYGTPSSSDGVRSSFHGQSGCMTSITTSRNSSLAPSRHLDEPSSILPPGRSASSRRPSPSGLRDPFASTTYSRAMNKHNDYLALRFNQMDLHNHSNSATTSVSPSPNAVIGREDSIQSASSGLRLPSLVYPSAANTLQRSASNVSGFSQSAYSRCPDSFRYQHGLAESQVSTYNFGSQEFRSKQAAADISEQHLDPTENRSNTSRQNGNQTRLSVARRTSIGAESPTIFDPRAHPFLASQLRDPFATSYRLHSAPHLAWPINMSLPFMPLICPSPAAQKATHSVLQKSVPDVSMQSALMQQFRATFKTKKYELRDIYDHVVEFSSDQHGSRFIQTKLETSTLEERERVFRELEPDLFALITDVFGNYVIQKFFEHGSQLQRQIIANSMQGRVVYLSTQQFGCRVVQKALDYGSQDQQWMLVKELDGAVVDCVKDMNGNHVIQKAIERCPVSMVDFIVAAFQNQVHRLSIHGYGCRVIQRCLEKPDLSSKAMILAELLDCVHTMIPDQFGNYVVQHIVVHDDGACKQRVLAYVANDVQNLSRHKYASNVVEKCIEHSNDVYRCSIIKALQASSQRRPDNEILASMVKDQYGNYVAQKLLDTLREDEYLLFVKILEPAIFRAKLSSPNNKQVLAVESKMGRFSCAHHEDPRGFTVYHNAQDSQLQLSFGQQRFVSNFNPVASVPPPPVRVLSMPHVFNIGSDTAIGARSNADTY